MNVDRAADALERLLLEEPQQLRLQARHHLADLVEKDRAAVGRLEQPALLPIGAGERAALVAEQLALEQRFRQRRAGDVHERLRRAAAVVVNHLGGQILAGAALARQQHRRRRARRDLLEQRLHRGDGRRLADDAIEAVGLGLARAQRPHFAPQLRRLERLLDEQRDLVEVERLVRVVIRALLHRLDGGLDARVRGQQDDERVGIALLDPLEHRQAVAVRQPVVEQHQIDALLALRERRRPPCRLRRRGSPPPSAAR